MMSVRMVLTLSLFLLLAPALLPAQAAPAQEVISPEKGRTVYLAPMGYGMDQYLANHLTVQRLYQVMTHPKDAELMFSDLLGPALGRKLRESFPEYFEEPAAPEEAEKKEEEKKGDTAVSAKVEPDEMRRGNWGQGKGNYFLLDYRSGRVLWSTYFRPDSFTPRDLDQAAKKIVDRLKKQVFAGKNPGGQ